MKRKYILVTLLCVVMLLGLPVPILGVDAIPPQMQSAPMNSASVPVAKGDIVISEDDGLERAPSVAYNPTANEYLVVWQMENASSVFGVYAQRVGLDGELISPTPIEIAANVGILHGSSTVAYDPVHQRYLIAYPNLNSDIYGRFVNSDGTTPQPSFAIASSGDNHESPEAAYGNTDGNFMVTWQVSTGIGTGIAAQVIPGDGSTINPASWTTVAFSADPERRENPDIAYNETHNEFDIVYERWDNARDYADIYATRVQPNGKIIDNCTGFGEVDSECSLWGFDTNERNPTIAVCDADDRILVLWEDDSGYDIVGRLSNNYNFSWVNAVTVANNPNLDERYPKLTCNFEGTEFMVTWQQWDASVGKSHYARSIDLSGSIGTAVDVEAPATTYPYSISDTSGLAGGRTNFFITWEQERIGMGYGDIYARFIVPNVVFMPMTLKMP